MKTTLSTDARFHGALHKTFALTMFSLGEEDAIPDPEAFDEAAHRRRAMERFDAFVLSGTMPWDVSTKLVAYEAIMSRSASTARKVYFMKDLADGIDHFSCDPEVPVIVYLDDNAIMLCVLAKETFYLHLFVHESCIAEGMSPNKAIAAIFSPEGDNMSGLKKIFASIGSACKQHALQLFTSFTITPVPADGIAIRAAEPKWLNERGFKVDQVKHLEHFTVHAEDEIGRVQEALFNSPYRKVAAICDIASPFDGVQSQAILSMLDQKRITFAPTSWGKKKDFEIQPSPQLMEPTADEMFEGGKIQPAFVANVIQRITNGILQNGYTSSFLAEAFKEGEPHPDDVGENFTRSNTLAALWSSRKAVDQAAAVKNLNQHYMYGYVDNGIVTLFQSSAALFGPLLYQAIASRLVASERYASMMSLLVDVLYGVTLADFVSKAFQFDEEQTARFFNSAYIKRGSVIVNAISNITLEQAIYSSFCTFNQPGCRAKTVGDRWFHFTANACLNFCSSCKTQLKELTLEQLRDKNRRVELCDRCYLRCGFVLYANARSVTAQNKLSGDNRNHLTTGISKNANVAWDFLRRFELFPIVKDPTLSTIDDANFKLINQEMDDRAFGLAFYIYEHCQTLIEQRGLEIRAKQTCSAPLIDVEGQACYLREDARSPAEFFRQTEETKKPAVLRIFDADTYYVNATNAFAGLTIQDNEALIVEPIEDPAQKETEMEINTDAPAPVEDAPAPVEDAPAPAASETPMAIQEPAPEQTQTQAQVEEEQEQASPVSELDQALILRYRSIQPDITGPELQRICLLFKQWCNFFPRFLQTEQNERGEFVEFSFDTKLARFDDYYRHVMAQDIDWNDEQQRLKQENQWVVDKIEIAFRAAMQEENTMVPSMASDVFALWASIGIMYGEDALEDFDALVERYNELCEKAPRRIDEQFDDFIARVRAYTDWMACASLPTDGPDGLENIRRFQLFQEWLNTEHAREIGDRLNYREKCQYHHWRDRMERGINTKDLMALLNDQQRLQLYMRFDSEFKQYQFTSKQNDLAYDLRIDIFEHNWKPAEGTNTADFIVWLDFIGRAAVNPDNIHMCLLLFQSGALPLPAAGEGRERVVKQREQQFAPTNSQVPLTGVKDPTLRQTLSKHLRNKMDEWLATQPLQMLGESVSRQFSAFSQHDRNANRSFARDETRPEEADWLERQSHTLIDGMTPCLLRHAFTMRIEVPVVDSNDRFMRYRKWRSFREPTGDNTMIEYAEYMHGRYKKKPELLQFVETPEFLRRQEEADDDSTTKAKRGRGTGSQSTKGKKKARVESSDDDNEEGEADSDEEEEDSDEEEARRGKDPRSSRVQTPVRPRGQRPAQAHGQSQKRRQNAHGRR